MDFSEFLDNFILTTAKLAICVMCVRPPKLWHLHSNNYSKGSPSEVSFPFDKAPGGDCGEWGYPNNEVRDFSKHYLGTYVYYCCEFFKIIV